MINIEKGRYWDEGVELISGCTSCSPGCDHCWSAGMTHRFDKFGDELHSLTLEDKPVFNGNVICHPDRLKRFKTRKPKVFAIWNDLFHEDVPDEFRDETYFAMHRAAMINEHRFLILTKRAKELLSYWDRFSKQGYHFDPYIWHGLTVCNQQEADEKIPIFLQVPGKKFLSIEPCLGEINLSKYAIGRNPHGDNQEIGPIIEQIDAVILGGETGPGARPLHPDWVRSVRDQCAAAGVSFFFKQWGEWAPNCLCGTKRTHMDTPRPQPGRMGCMFKCGRKKAGRLLDGRTHDDLPWVKA